jgi:hypothetical protein
MVTVSVSVSATASATAIVTVTVTVTARCVASPTGRVRAGTQTQLIVAVPICSDCRRGTCCRACVSCVVA